MVGNNRSEIITTLAASEGAIGGTGWVFSSSRKPVSENCLTRSFLRGDWDGPWNGWALGSALGRTTAIRGPLTTPVVIVQTLNIVFAQIRSRLHFYQLQRDFPWVAQPVGHAHGNISGLIFGQKQGLIALLHLGGASDHNPMLRSVIVHLQRQTGAGFYGDAFNLITGARVHGIVATPGSVTS